MTVKEFSALIGIPSSKIRFYDRLKIVEGDREILNNYRSFCNDDVLSIYHAQMLRSFNFSLQEVQEAKTEELHQIDSRLHERIDALERSIREQEMRLKRMKEMTVYFSKIERNISKCSYHELDDSYNIFTINCDSTPDERAAVKLLAEVMPFSYICVRISKDSILHNESPLKVSLGLGILESNRQKIGLSFPPSIKIDHKGMKVGMFMECNDLFNIQCSDIAPLLDEFNERQIPLSEDLTGRVFISYRHNGETVHGIGFGIKTLDL